MRNKPQITLAVAMLLAFLAYAAYQYVYQKQHQAPTEFTFNNVTYKFTSVALTLQQQEQGLMNSSVNSSTFELFVFPKSSIYPFWMKNTYSQLDIIWVNQSSVVYIANATPCVDYSQNQSDCKVYVPEAAANYVVEAQAGFVNATGMHVGSEVYIH